MAITLQIISMSNRLGLVFLLLQILAAAVVIRALSNVSEWTFFPFPSPWHL